MTARSAELFYSKCVSLTQELRKDVSWPAEETATYLETTYTKRGATALLIKAILHTQKVLSHFEDAQKIVIPQGDIGKPLNSLDTLPKEQLIVISAVVDRSYIVGGFKLFLMEVLHEHFL